MTENERMSISGLLDVLNTGISFSTCHIEYAIQSDILEDLISCLEELEQYRAIGTVEELKFLVENIGSIKLLKEYNSIGTVDEFKALQYDRGQYERGHKDGYARAIDDFAKKLFDVAYEDYESDKLIIDYVDVVKIAEEMRCAE